MQNTTASPCSGRSYEPGHSSCLPPSKDIEVPVSTSGASPSSKSSCSTSTIIRGHRRHHARHHAVYGLRKDPGAVLGRDEKLGRLCTTMDQNPVLTIAQRRKNDMSMNRYFAISTGAPAVAGSAAALLLSLVISLRQAPR